MLKLISIVSMIPSNHLILCHRFLLLPSIFPNIRVFSNELALCIKWPKYWSFSFSINPSNEHPGRISFRMDCLDLLAVQGTLKSLPQYHSSNASIFWCLAFLMAQLSHPYLMFIFCKNTKISTNCWTTVDRRMLEPTKKDTLHVRTKEKLQQDGRMGTILLKSNPILTGDSWRAQTKPCSHQDPGKSSSDPQQETEPDLLVKV